MNGIGKLESEFKDKRNYYRIDGTRTKIRSHTHPHTHNHAYFIHDGILVFHENNLQLAQIKTRQIYMKKDTYFQIGANHNKQNTDTNQCARAPYIFVDYYLRNDPVPIAGYFKKSSKPENQAHSLCPSLICQCSIANSFFYIHYHQHNVIERT